MDVHERGMLDQDTWENFFDVKKIFAMLKLNNRVHDVVELGCGYGTFTIPAAEIISGKIVAVDNDPEMIRLTSERIQQHRLENVEVIQRDFIATGSSVKNRSMEYVMLFNILNADNQQILFKEAKRVLKKWGQVAVLQWNNEADMPDGFDIAESPRPEQCREWARAAGLGFVGQFDIKPYHCGMVFVKGNTLKSSWTMGK
ncbi:MAG: class I SAM-dependent methyltransferase [Candidatus Omnitrophica bacterium]|nr:class I SAM-dependent methyltransferase [Candidatus Omnitrophota bacterium]